MFTMMNQARLGVGVQGVGLAEHAFQDALAYAPDRKQGSIETTAPNDMTPIINHPDVRRMLMSMKAKIAAARAICSINAVAIDMARHGRDEAARAKADALAALLTPVSKSFGSDIAVEVASEGIQVHGGMGFIEETGAAQHYRDARIAPIYEGTNGIQAIDLVGAQAADAEWRDRAGLHRRFEGDGGRKRRPRTSRHSARWRRASPTASPISRRPPAGCCASSPRHRKAALAGATPYGRLFALAAGGVFLARGALAAARGANGADAAADGTSPWRGISPRPRRR